MPTVGRPLLRRLVPLLLVGCAGNGGSADSTPKDTGYPYYQISPDIPTEFHSYRSEVKSFTFAEGSDWQTIEFIGDGVAVPPCPDCDWAFDVRFDVNWQGSTMALSPEWTDGFDLTQDDPLFLTKGDGMDWVQLAQLYPAAYTTNLILGFCSGCYGGSPALFTFFDNAWVLSASISSGGAWEVDNYYYYVGGDAEFNEPTFSYFKSWWAEGPYYTFAQTAQGWAFVY